MWVASCIPTLPLTIATRESCLMWLVFMHMRPSNLFPTSIIYDHSPCHVIAHSPHQPSKTLTAIRPFHRSSPSFIIQAGPYRNGSRSSDRPWHWLELICWLWVLKPFTHECHIMCHPQPAAAAGGKCSIVELRCHFWSPASGYIHRTYLLMLTASNKSQLFP